MLLPMPCRYYLRYAIMPPPIYTLPADTTAILRHFAIIYYLFYIIFSDYFLIYAIADTILRRYTPMPRYLFFFRCL